MITNNLNLNYNGYNTAAKRNYQQNNIAFKGTASVAKEASENFIKTGFEVFKNTTAKPIAKLWVKLADSQFARKTVGKLTGTPLAYTHLMTLESIVIGGFYMRNTAKNPKIEKKQKMPLMINDGLVTAVSAFLNYTIDGKIKNSVKELQNSVKNNCIKNAVVDLLDGAKDIVSPEKLAEICKKVDSPSILGNKEFIKETIEGTFESPVAKQIMNTLTPEKMAVAAEKASKAADINMVIKGIDKCKGIIIFTFIYRYLSPVLITPIANKISGKIQNSIKAKKEQATKPAPVQAQTAQKAEETKKV